MKYTFLISFLVTFISQNISATELYECKSNAGDVISWFSNYKGEGSLEIDRVNGKREKIEKLTENGPFIKKTTPLTIVTKIVFESQPDVVVAEIYSNSGKIHIIYDNETFLCDDNNNNN